MRLSQHIESYIQILICFFPNILPPSSHGGSTSVWVLLIAGLYRFQGFSIAFLYGARRLQRRWGSAPCLGLSKSGSNQATGWDYYLGTAGMNSVSTKIPVLVIAPLFSITVTLPLVEPLQIPLQILRGEIRVDAPIKTKNPWCWEEVASCSTGLSFTTGGTEAQGDLSRYWAVLENVVNLYMFLLPSNALCLHLCGLGVASVSPLCSRILLVVLCSWIIVSCSSCEGSKVRNNPCHHLGEVTLLKFDLYL